MSSTSFNPFDEFGGPSQQCVLPLVAKVDDSLFPVGTGFVINSDGLFVTAAHVLTEAHAKAVRRQNQEDTQYYDHLEFYAIYVSQEPIPGTNHTVGGLLPIDYAWIPNELDIGFGWLRLPRRVPENTLLHTYSVRIRPAIPKIGDKITALGYYKMTGAFKMGEPAIIEYALETAISQGTIQEVYPTYRDKGMLSFPCFQTDARFDHGMSGGPIFDEHGNVCGVVCSGLNSFKETSVEDTNEFISYGSLIWPIFGCHIDIAKQPGSPPEKTLLYDLAHEGHIITDDTLNYVQVVTNKDGSRSISIQVPNS